MAFRNRINCYVCDIRLAPQQMVRIHAEQNAHRGQIAIARRDGYGRPALEVTPITRICLNCNNSISREIEIIQANPACLRLNVLVQTRNQSCFICNAVDDIHRLSADCKAYIFIESNIYVPDNVKSCNIHLDGRGYLLGPLLQGLNSINRPYIIQGHTLALFLQGMRTVSRVQTRLEHIDDCTDDEMYTLTSLTKHQFRELLTNCDRVPCQNGFRYVKAKDLFAFLCKLRQGLSDEFLTVLFKYSTRQATSLAISTVRQSLMQHFVPRNIGLDAITRDQYIQRHVTEFSNELYNPHPENAIAIVMFDGTYTYCHKSSNFRSLRQTYCLHKGRHLIKPALLVAPDGYILDIHGPYFSDSRNNDAAMLRCEFENNERMNEWFHEYDIAVVDRGYRDAIPMMEEFGLVCKMPISLEARERQLTTENANETRKVTKIRWLVEARNGHIKSIFKLLGGVMQIHVLPNVGDYYRIAGALINRFHEPIIMNGADAALAREFNHRARQPNTMQIRVEAENLGTRNAQRWVSLNTEQVNDFPVLSMDYLRHITTGIYQIKLAPGYVQDKMQREEKEEFQVEMLRDENRLPEPGLLRVRLYSRFRNATKHQLWISYVPHGIDNPEPITAFYCTCKSGARTLGTCAHNTCVLWYMGYAKHQDNVKYPSQRMLNTVKDAGNRPQQINPN